MKENSFIYNLMTIAGFCLLVSTAARGWYWGYNAFNPYGYSELWLISLAMGFLVGLPAAAVADAITLINYLHDIETNPGWNILRGGTFCFFAGGLLIVFGSAKDAHPNHKNES